MSNVVSNYSHLSLAQRAALLDAPKDATGSPALRHTVQPQTRAALIKKGLVTEYGWPYLTEVGERAQAALQAIEAGVDAGATPSPEWVQILVSRIANEVATLRRCATRDSDTDYGNGLNKGFEMAAEWLTRSTAQSIRELGLTELFQDTIDKAPQT